MSISEDQVAPALPPRKGLGLRITVLGMLALVAGAAAVMAVYRRVPHAVDERPSLIAKYEKTAPAADGVIRPKEYGPVVSIQWNDEETRRQASNAYLRTARQTQAPYYGGENAWNFGIKLEPRWFFW